MCFKTIDKNVFILRFSMLMRRNKCQSDDRAVEIIFFLFSLELTLFYFSIVVD